MPRTRQGNYSVTVTMPDGKTGKTTIRRLRKAFAKQSDTWRENFFYHLLNIGSIKTDTANYSLDRVPRCDGPQTQEK